MHLTSLFPRRLAALLLPLLALLALAPAPVRAAVVIRDTEIERHLADLARPVFEAAGLAPDGVTMVILRDPAINAFVTGGRRLFVHTGLLAATETPEQLAGVLAHEAGHMAGGHLVRLADEVRRAAVQSLLGAVLGAAAAAAGAPEVGTALVLGGQDVARRKFLSFTRTQESLADQAAVSALERAGIDPGALVRFLAVMRRHEAMMGVGGDVYLRTHPLTDERIARLRQRVERSPARGRRLSAEVHRRHARMRAKLEGFLARDPATVIAARCTGSGFADAYACAIALFRAGRTEEAFARIEALLAERPDDPYLHELLGQFRFESGDLAGAEAPWRRAVALLPDAPLLRLGLARVLVERGGRARLEEARRHLAVAVREDPDAAQAHRLLGVVLGRLGETAASYVELAEWALRRGRLDDAALYLERAEAAGAGSELALRLADLRAELERARAEAKRRRRR